MFEVREKPEMVEKAMLIGFCFDKSEEAETQLLLTELEELVDTLGIGVTGIELVRVRDTNKRFICGTGKADGLGALARAGGCDCMVFDNEISPMQQRNWEELSDMTVIDREEVILDIFAKRARTKEARLQVGHSQISSSRHVLGKPGIAHFRPPPTRRGIPDAWKKQPAAINPAQFPKD